MDFKYPYTDFHELNLDWFLAEFKKLTAEWLQVQHDWEDEQQAFQDLHDYVQDYFANLNLYQEVHDILYSPEMQQTIQLMLSNITASTLPTVVANQIASVVASQLAPVVAAQLPNLLNSMVPSFLPDAVAGEASAWLDAHVDPDTGYVIDNTLTISLAAADAKAVGDEFIEVRDDIDEINEKIISTPHPINIYNERHETVNYPNARINRGTIYLNGYTGDLCFSTYGNYAQYFSNLHVYDAANTDMGISFGATYLWNQSVTRRGVVVNIPSGAVYLKFDWQYKSSSDTTVISYPMVSEQSTVPESYTAYDTDNELHNAPYLITVPQNFVYVSSTSGNDGNDGLTKLTALKTINAALAKNVDYIYAEAGQYNEALSVIDRKDLHIIAWRSSETYTHPNPIRDKVRLTGTISNMYLAYFLRCDGLYLEDIIFDTANSNVCYIHSSSNVHLRDCEATGSIAANGFSMDFSDVILDNCIAHDNHMDGFNFHHYGMSVMNDCYSIDNGDDGCSHHDGCIGTVSGGVFKGNGKAGIAPAYGAFVNIYGAFCLNNVLGIAYLSTNNGHRSMEGIIEGCVMADNSISGLTVQPLCTVRSANCKYSNNAADKQVSGTLIEY